MNKTEKRAQQLAEQLGWTTEQVQEAFKTELSEFEHAQRRRALRKHNENRNARYEVLRTKFEAVLNSSMGGELSIRINDLYEKLLDKWEFSSASRSG